MNAKIIFLILAAALIIPPTFYQKTAFAEDLSVKQNDATCLQTATPPCFGTIGAAITYANNIISNASNTFNSPDFSIRVEAGTYTENITLGAGISIQGRETAKTKMTGGGSGTLITVNGGSPTISNLLFSNAQVGIEINNATATSSPTIKNNIFNLGLGGTAVQITQITSPVSVTNNTFYSNNVAVNSNVDSPIKKNIFLNNTVALAPAPLSTFTSYNVTDNDFYPANTIAPEFILVGGTSNNISLDPSFVNITNGDFHLRANSPCIDSSSTSKNDIGAYGEGADTIPFQVAEVTAVQDSDTSFSVNWTKNLDYKVTGYRVWYGRTSGGPYDGTDATGGNPSPISVPTGTAESTYLLSGLSTTVNTPESPVLDQPSPMNESLVLSWSAVPGATGYRVYYGESSPSSPAIEVGNNTTYTLSGLTNGQTYYVAVSAISQALYYIAVTAVEGNVTGSARDESFESIYSAEKSVGTGEIKESAISNVRSDFPEAVIPYPNLSNSGQKCFIATAAYGYDAPEVQALREFRDHYLLTNKAGRVFVRWYYEHSPVAAAYLNAHPGYKPVVRAALMPAVGAALFMTNTALFIKAVVTLVILIIALLTAYRFFRKRLSGIGGTH